MHTTRKRQQIFFFIPQWVSLLGNLRPPPERKMKNGIQVWSVTTPTSNTTVIVQSLKPWYGWGTQVHNFKLLRSYSRTYLYLPLWYTLVTPSASTWTETQRYQMRWDKFMTAADCISWNWKHGFSAKLNCQTVTGCISENWQQFLEHLPDGNRYMFITAADCIS